GRGRAPRPWPASARPQPECSAGAPGHSSSPTGYGSGSNERLEQLVRRVAVGAVNGGRARAEIERTVGGIQQQGHQIRAAELTEDAGRELEPAEARDAVRPDARARAQECPRPPPPAH